MTRSQIENLAFGNNSVYAKTFSTFDKKLIDFCHFYVRYMTFPLLYDLKRFNLLIPFLINMLILFPLLGCFFVSLVKMNFLKKIEFTNVNFLVMY